MSNTLPGNIADQLDYEEWLASEVIVDKALYLNQIRLPLIISYHPRKFLKVWKAKNQIALAIYHNKVLPKNGSNKITIIKVAKDEESWKNGGTNWKVENEKGNLVTQ